MNLEPQLEEEYLCDDSISDDVQFSDTESDEEATTNEIKSSNFTKLENKVRSEMINKRSIINEIHDLVKAKSEKYDKINGEYEICKIHIEELAKEKQLTELEIEKNKSEENISAIFRLQAQLKRIHIEIESEEELLKSISKKLVEAEQEKIQALLMESSQNLEEFQLEDEEKKYQEISNKISKQRILNETKLTGNALKSYRQRELQHEETSKFEQKIFENKIEIANRTHKKNAKYLRKTLKNIKLKEDQQYNQEMELLNRKEQSKVKLDKDIKFINENLTAIRSKKLADRAKETAKEEAMEKEVLAKGGNPKLELNILKNAIKSQQTQEKLLAKIQENKVQIAEKILKEENNIKKKKTKQPYLFDRSKSSIDKHQPLIRNASLVGDSLNQHQENNYNEKSVWENWEKRSNAGRSSIVEIRQVDEHEDSESDKELFTQSQIPQQDDILNKPEFEGLWNISIPYKVLSKDAVNNPIKNNPKASQMDQEIMSRQLLKLKENLVQPQFVNGREFTGISFQSKPEVIKFEDLEVGENYTKKVVLTNTSYASNQCRFLNMSENLLDFVEVKFVPAGSLSPGMTCDFTINFQPQLNVDLEGQLMFVSKSDRFVIPVVCLIKKCKMSITREHVIFDTTIIEETLEESIILRNSGAKGTFCWVKPLPIEESHEDPDQIPIALETSDQRMSCSLDSRKIWLEGHSELSVVVKWNPLRPGEYSEVFTIEFEDPDNPPFVLQCNGRAIDVPVYLDHPDVCMNICMVDRLYQDSITFFSRATTALKLQFHLPDSVRDFMEILPNTGFIQAGQSFKAQLKMLPTETLLDPNAELVSSCFDRATGVLEVPVRTSIAGQVKSVDFCVRAVITTTELQLMLDENTDGDLLDFGFCTIRETRVKKIKLINRSMLAQQFGFTGYPEFIEIQPNYGYGTILPKEELEFDVLFSPSKAEDYEFQIKCQSLINRIFSIKARGIGVHPTLDLSEQVVQMPLTSIGDVVSCEVFIDNSHLSTNIYTHEPPRIGSSGNIAPIEARTFNFQLADSSFDIEQVPISIYPQVGTVHPGEKKKLTIFYEPMLSPTEIAEEAARIMTVQKQLEAQKKWENDIQLLEEEEAKQQTGVGEVAPSGSAKQKKAIGAKKSGSNSGKAGNDNSTGSKVLPELSLSQLREAGVRPVTPVLPESLSPECDEFLRGKLSLVQSYRYHLECFKFSCLIGTQDKDGTSTVNYDYRNTLYLEVHCPSVRPDLILISNYGRHIIDFGSSIVLKKSTKVLSIQNISNKSITMKSPLLNPNGPFQILNALRKIDPGSTCNILLAFEPKEPGLYQTEWTISGQESEKTLKLRFKGQAEVPKLQLKEAQAVQSDDKKLYQFNCGKVLSMEYIERTLTIENQTRFPLDVSIDLSDNSPIKFDTDIQSTTVQHPASSNQNNLSGMAVFNWIPRKFHLLPDKSQLCTVTFAPDHESDKFQQIATIKLFDDVEYCQVKLIGQSKTKMMYLADLDQSPNNQIKDYLGEQWPIKIDENIQEPEKKRLLLEMIGCYKNGVISEMKSHFTIGFIKSTSPTAKKSGEFTIDNMNVLTPLGFTVDQQKGSVEADTEKQILIAWLPPNSYQIGSLVSTSLSLTLKADVSTQYLIDVKAFVK